LTRVSDIAVQARLHTGEGGTYLWVVNPGRTAKAVTVTVDAGRAGSFRRGREVWQIGMPAVEIAGTQVRLTVQDRNAAVIRLET